MQAKTFWDLSCRDAKKKQIGTLMNENATPSHHSAASLSARSDFIDHAEAVDQYLISSAGLPDGVVSRNFVFEQNKKSWMRN